ncbi:MAG TPA: glycogen debranching N-terminal domain-containing protein [Chloroflexota bacterium]
MEHRRIIKQGTVVVATQEDGSIDPAGTFSQGLFVGDTRFLSRFRIYLDGVSPDLMGCFAPDRPVPAATDARLRCSRGGCDGQGDESGLVWLLDAALHRSSRTIRLAVLSLRQSDVIRRTFEFLGRSSNTDCRRVFLSR